MGYQPALDGLRAVSVIGVILYHAGFSWMRGGFFGVEVFFVVSGFLITSLLIDEEEQPAGSAARSSSRLPIDLKQFWLRRARRLLAALFAVLVAVALWSAFAGTDEQQSQLRRDLPWAIFYAGNWGQILGDVPYYAGEPPLLRHLWSLAVEEQWYLVWPLLFVGLSLTRLSRPAKARLVGGAAIAAMILMAWLHRNGPGPIGGFGPFDGVDRVNFMYLSTFTRCSGLLLGAAAAFVWRPWRRPIVGGDEATRRPGLLLDVVGAGAVGSLVAIAAVAVLTEGYVYQWLLGLVSVLSLVGVLVAVHPAALGFRTVFSWRPLVEIGKRSYGLYLWHWPIFVFAKAPHGSTARVVGALVVTAVVSELCYRFVETPVRRGELGHWYRTAGEKRLVPLAAAAALVVGLVTFYATVDRFDRAAGGTDETFVAPTTAPALAVVPAPTTAAAAAPPATAAAAAPRRVVVVGDSQAHSLAINLPDGIEDTFDITNGALPGCSIYDGGRVFSTRAGFTNNFASCDGWADDWGEAAADADAEVALVVLGAWDVFDLETDAGEDLTFGTSAWDEYVTGNLQRGVDALVAAGARVALLEVPCMRPKDVEGAGVPALPERGDDDRVAHLNDLWREVASNNQDTVTFVDGPDEWCGDETIANDLGYRWDGVHVYLPGANLIYTTIAPALVAL
jgi:peptidoglycan/LPS O-acetylase OafA/YrhL